MFRHSVMFRWNDDATSEAKAAVAAGLDALSTMECISTFTHGGDLGVSDGNWDYAVVADFASEEHYAIYANDVDHLALIADVIKPNIAGRTAVQFTI